MLQARLYGYFICFFIAILPGLCNADKRFYRDASYGFSLSYPDSFEEVEIAHPLVAFALRHPITGFPTLNIVVQPGSFDLRQKGPNSPENRILESYHLIGLTDVEFIEGESKLENSFPYYVATLSYQDSNQNLKSSVALFSGQDQHFFITFIDDEKSFTTNRHIFSDICESFKIDDMPPVNDTDAMSPLRIFLLGGFIAVLASLSWFKWRRNL